MKLTQSLLFCAFLLFAGCATSNVCKQNSDCTSSQICSAGICLSSLLEKKQGDASALKETQPQEPQESCSTPNATRPCYTGPPGTQNVGICIAGEQLCDKGFWSSCEGQTLPREELCDGADNNCDGKVDEVCRTCQPKETRPCYTGSPSTKGVGECKEGIQTCLGIAEWGQCLQQTHPSMELCNKKDDDCNGKIDDNCKDCVPTTTELCYPSNTLGCTPTPTGFTCKGKCKAGNRICLPEGKWSACEGFQTPTIEYCNNTDDDCNGKVDDNMIAPLCSLQNGVCAGAKQKCGSGVWIDCTHSDYLAHHPKYNQQKEIICDQLDNNCDGRVDEDCSVCVPGESRACYGGGANTQKNGSCKAGLQLCGNDLKWGTCSGQVLPVTEICNGKDDDCNGKIDESFPELGSFCTSPQKGICSQGIYQCNAGKLECTPLFQPIIEICNGKDDDCNGIVDDAKKQYTFYEDLDGDGFGNSQKSTQSCTKPSNTSTIAGDCYDTNKEVYPNQGSFFAKNRGDNSFDYNCDGKEEKRFLNKGSCNNCQSAIITNGYIDSPPECGKAGKWLDQCHFDVGKCNPITIDKVQECR